MRTRVKRGLPRRVEVSALALLLRCIDRLPAVRVVPFFCQTLRLLHGQPRRGRCHPTWRCACTPSWSTSRSRTRRRTRCAYPLPFIIIIITAVVCVWAIAVTSVVPGSPALVVLPPAVHSDGGALVAAVPQARHARLQGRRVRGAAEVPRRTAEGRALHAAVRVLQVVR